MLDAGARLDVGGDAVAYADATDPLRAGVTTGAAGRLHLELSGPLRLPASHRGDAVTAVALRPRNPSEEIPC